MSKLVVNTIEPQAGFTSVTFNTNINTTSFNVTGVSTFGAIDVRSFNASFGTSSASQIDINGNGGTIIKNNGSLTLYGGGTAGSEVGILNNSNIYLKPNTGGVDLYHGKTDKKLETTTNGISVTGDVSLTSELNFTGPAAKYVDFYTKDSGGTAYSANLRLVNHDSSSFHNAVKMIRDGAVELYHNNSKKFETTGIGVTVSGIVSATAFYGDGSNLTGVAGELQVTSKTSAYTLTSDDANTLITITTGGITVPASVFSTGQSVLVYNNSASSQTITQGASVTLRLAGTSDTGNRTLEQRGLSTILCVASNEFVVTGSGLL